MGCSQAFAADAPETAWINLFDGTTSAGDNNISVAAAGENAIYWLNTLGSTDAAPDIFYNGEKIFTGSPYTGTSYANNLALTKTDAAGTALWTVYSNSGDYSSGDGAIAVAADGSVVIVGKVRHTDGRLDTPLTLVDATGVTTTFGGTVEARYYSLVIAKVSAEGAIEWLRTVDVDHGASPDGSKTAVADAVSAKAVAVDADGNIYVGGSASMPLTFATTGGTATFTPRNNAAWNGDSQHPAASLFIAKFDAEGYYTGCLTTSGNTMNTEQIWDVIYENGKLYATGTMTAATDDVTTASLGGKELSATSLASPFVAAITTGLDVEWATSLKAEAVDGKSAWQASHITAVGNTLWLASVANGKYSLFDDASKTVATQQGTQREGLLVKFDATDGAWLAAADSRDGFSDAVLGGYLKAVQNPSAADKVYVYGYLMNGSKGAFIRGYDAATLTADTAEDWFVVAGGGMPTAKGFAYEPSAARAYMAVRGNAKFTGTGSMESAVPTKWAVAAVRVDLPEAFQSGVENVAAVAAADVTVVAGAGCITVSSADTATVAVYDLAGRTVAVLALDGDSATVNVEAGLYIVAGKKVLVK